MKRLLIVALAFLGAPILTVEAQGTGTPWTCSLDNLADAITVCQRSRGDGTTIYITDIVAQTTGATSDLFNLSVDVGSYTGAATCPGTGPSIFPAAATVGIRSWRAPGNTEPPYIFGPGKDLVVPKGYDLCVTGGGTTTLSIQISGYYQ